MMAKKVSGLWYNTAMRPNTRLCFTERMLKMRFHLCGFFLSFFGFALCAAPTITVDRVQQRYPWNNVVDIDYTITGLTGDPYDYRVEMSVSSPALAKPIVVSNFINCAWCDLVTSNGTWRASWNSKADGVNFTDANAKVSMRLVYMPITADEAKYMIIDLSCGNGATAYPTRLVREDAPEPSQFLRDVYKTDRLVLKRVYAVENAEGYTFMMTDSNKKSHKVLLTNDYFLGVFPMTQRQYKRVSGKNPSYFSTDAADNPAAHRPAENMLQTDVKWDVMYDLSEKVVFRAPYKPVFSLPTEAQMEYAIRAGTTTEWYWGSDGSKVCDYAWVSANSGGTTHPVGLKKPNDWGFYDMQGNVAVWCSDWYGGYSTDPAYVDGGVTVDPLGSGTGRTYFVNRGASYKSNAVDQTWRAKSGYREFNLASYQKGDYVGLRVSMRIP